MAKYAYTNPNVIADSLTANISERKNFLAFKSDKVTVVKLGFPLTYYGRPTLSWVAANLYYDRQHEFQDEYFSNAFDTGIAHYDPDGPPRNLIYKIRLEVGWKIILVYDLPCGLKAGSRYEIRHIHTLFMLCVSIEGPNAGMVYCIERFDNDYSRQYPVCVDLTANILSQFGPVVLNQEQYDSFLEMEQWRSNENYGVFPNYNHVYVEGHLAGSLTHLAVIYLSRFKFIPNQDRYYLIVE